MITIKLPEIIITRFHIIKFVTDMVTVIAVATTITVYHWKVDSIGNTTTTIIIIIVNNSIKIN